MNEHIQNFFTDNPPGKYFHQVISLHESKDLDWAIISELVPLLPRGWYELSRLSPADRIEFTLEYWLSKLPFMSQENVNLERKLHEFFENLEEIGIYATQGRKEEPFEIRMVYSLNAAAGFFQGNPPANEVAIETLTKSFGHINFPKDYLAFLQVHDGFSKYTDMGLIRSRDMSQVYQKFQHLLAEQILIRPDGQIIDPVSLLPFYESFGLHCYQCFYADWRPKKDMGNVYFSEYDRTISNFIDRNGSEKNLAFASFLSWLIFYLEDI